MKIAKNTKSQERIRLANNLQLIEALLGTEKWHLLKAETNYANCISPLSPFKYLQHWLPFISSERKYGFTQKKSVSAGKNYYKYAKKKIAMNANYNLLSSIFLGAEFSAEFRSSHNNLVFNLQNHIVTLIFLQSDAKCR